MNSTVAPGTTWNGWKVISVSRGFATYTEVDLITGQKREVPGREDVVLAEHPELGGLDCSVQDWFDLIEGRWTIE